MICRHGSGVKSILERSSRGFLEDGRFLPFGDILAGCPLRRADALEESGIPGGGYSHSGLGDRREHVLGDGMKLASVGVGVVCSLALTRLMAKMLYGVSPSDPVTFLTIAVLLLLIAMAACYVPARRALRVDPAIALRYD